MHAVIKYASAYLTVILRGIWSDVHLPDELMNNVTWSCVYFFFGTNYKLSWYLDHDSYKKKYIKIFIVLKVKQMISFSLMSSTTSRKTQHHVLDHREIENIISIFILF